MTHSGPWWGTTSSSLQAEGVAPAADWSRWERDKRVPPSGDGNGFATNHVDDLGLIAQLGVSHVRIGLEWARLEPEPGRTDATAFDRYDDILTSAKRAGLRTIATLHHGSLPGWFSEDAVGYLDDHGRDYTWATHVDRCAERFDGLVDTWVPIDDPVGWAIRGFLLGTRPPGRRDPEQAARAIEAALLANHVAWQLLRSGTTPVMAVFGTPTIFGHGEENDAQRRAWHDLLFTPWISAIRDGELRVPGRPTRELAELAGAFDLIGVNHDHPIAVDRSGNVHPYPGAARRTDTGFTPIPSEIGELLSYLASELPGRDLVVAGHGIPTSDDEWREQLLQQTVDIVRDAAQHDVPVVGYLHDTGIDGYEGPYGFATQRGLIGRDRELKDSGRWLQENL